MEHNNILGGTNLNVPPVLPPCNRDHVELPALPVSFAARSLQRIHLADYQRMTAE